MVTLTLTIIITVIIVTVSITISPPLASTTLVRTFRGVVTAWR